MITLTSEQNDCFREILNIGICHAAKKLSLILNDEINISAPDLKIATLDSIAKLYNEDEYKELSCVSQNMDGEIRGQCILAFTGEDSILLTEAILNNLPANIFTSSETKEESLVEVANVIMSSCLSTLADLLNTPISLSVPKYMDTNPLDLLHSCVQYQKSKFENQSSLAIIMSTVLSAASKSAKGKLLFIENIGSMNVILEQMNVYCRR